MKTGGNEYRHMKEITVVDARMGRGKSSAAIRYMNEHKKDKRFLYITPFCTEVDRICEACGFDQPEGDDATKSFELKMLLQQGDSIAATHSLFGLMDEEALKIVRDKKYTLFMDESINTISRININARDMSVLLENYVTEGDLHRLSWIDKEYKGKFSDCKNMADSGGLFHLDAALIFMMNPDLITSFDEAFIMTYMFDGQYQRAYFEYHGFPYRVVGIEADEAGYLFSDKPDCPPPIDYHKLINLVEDKKLYAVGNSRFALSKKWFSTKGYDNKDVKTLRNGMNRVFRFTMNATNDSRMWTSLKSATEKLIEKETNRFRSNFVQVNSRATNDYRNKTDLIYLANRFLDPNLQKMFAQKNIYIDADKFALAEMVQWIWRSAIRDDKPINLCIPSKRMRTLLTDWIEQVSKGGAAA